MTPREPLAQEYVHHPLNQEVNAISGCYVLVKEVRMPFRGREVLYLVGHAAFDACCGAGGCVYGLVPGFVLSWKSSTNEHGLAVSQVEPIRDEALQKELEQLLDKQEMIQQVVFQ